MEEKHVQETKERARTSIDSRRSGDEVCKLKKSNYLVKKAVNQWDKMDDKDFRNFGLFKSMSNTCVLYSNGSNYVLPIDLYVDFLCNHLSKMSRLKAALCPVCDMKVLGKEAHLLGMEILQNGVKRVIKEEAKAKEGLKSFNMGIFLPLKTPVRIGKELENSGSATVKGKEMIPYRQAVGSLMDFATCTRFKIAMATSSCLKFLDAKISGSTNFKIEFVRDEIRELGIFENFDCFENFIDFRIENKTAIIRQLVRANDSKIARAPNGFSDDVGSVETSP